MKHHGCMMHLARRILDGRPALLIFCVVVVHAQVALSLLVECVRADGISLVEVMGQDPCRHLAIPGATVCEDHWFQESARLTESADSCVDLALDGLGVAPTATAIQSLRVSSNGQRLDAVGGCSPASPGPETYGLFRRAREPVLTSRPGPQLSLPLRV